MVYAQHFMTVSRTRAGLVPALPETEIAPKEGCAKHFPVPTSPQLGYELLYKSSICSSPVC